MPRIRLLRWSLAVSLALAALPALAQPNATLDIHAAARAAVTGNQTERTNPRGYSDRRSAFDEANVKGGVLIGFDLGLSPWFDSEVITAVRPIYRTAAGISYGRDYGLFAVPDRSKRNAPDKQLKLVKLRAPAGSAVGGMKMRTGAGLDGFSLFYHKITGDRLEPTATTRSEFVGNLGGGSESTLTTNGSPVVGVFGNLSSDRTKVTTVGLIHIAAAPPAAEKPPDPRPDVKSTPAAKKAKAPPKAKAKPVEPPPVEDEPVKEPAAPAKAAAEVEPEDEEAPPQRPTWLPLAVFGGVSVVIFLPMTLLLGKKKRRPIQAKRPQPPPAAKAEAPPPGEPSMEGICAEPGRPLFLPALPPFFEAVSQFQIRANRRYRVYVREDELWFLEAGKGPDTPTPYERVLQFFGVRQELLPLTADERAKVKALDDGPMAELERRLALGGFNFRFAGHDLRDVRIDLPWWLDARAGALACLRVRHATDGDYVLLLYSVEQVQQAIALLPEALGGKVVVNAVYDRLGQRFVNKY